MAHNQIRDNVSTVAPTRDGGSNLLSDSFLKYSTDEKFHQSNVDNNEDNNSVDVSVIILACFINGIIIVAIIYICYHYKLNNIIGKANRIQSEE